MAEHIDPRHQDKRAFLRLVGPLILIVGVIFTIVGLASFFSSFNEPSEPIHLPQFQHAINPDGNLEFHLDNERHRGPRYFWCVFVGFPLIGVGSMICKFAFAGSVLRYMVNESMPAGKDAANFMGQEIAPIGKDVINYMASGTKDSIREIAAAVGEGLRGEDDSDEVQDVRCQKCHTENDASAKFCDRCGEALPKAMACGGCGKVNDPDAKFCDQCGATL